MNKINYTYCLVALIFLALPANAADKRINTDLIVAGSGTCVGTNCLSSESFGTVSLRLKEVNTRISFYDQSVVPGFPFHDWSLEANDSKHYGANYFALRDITGNTRPFKIMGGALTNSFYIDQSGKLGMGTSAPAADLHLNTGLSPYLTFEQSAGPYPSSSWKLSANESYLSIINNYSGDRVAPFRVDAGSPNDVLVVASSGDVGIGTRTPNATLNVHGANAMMTVNNNNVDSNLEFVMSLESSSDNTTWLALVEDAAEVHIGIVESDNDIDESTNLFFANTNSKVEQFSMDTTGTVYIEGQFVSSSSAKRKKDIKLVDKQLILEKVKALQVKEVEDLQGDQGKRLLLSSRAVSRVLGHVEDQQHGATDISGLVLAGVQAIAEKMDDTSKLLSGLEVDVDNMLAARNDKDNEIEGLLAEIAGLE